MNREETLEAIKVMQHFADGGEVQMRTSDRDCWDNWIHPAWNWNDCQYRIKHKPLECWVVVDRDGDFCDTFALRRDAQASTDSRNLHGFCAPYFVKHMVEVTE